MRKILPIYVRIILESQNYYTSEIIKDKRQQKQKVKVTETEPEPI